MYQSRDTKQSAVKGLLLRTRGPLFLCLNTIFLRFSFKFQETWWIMQQLILLHISRSFHFAIYLVRESPLIGDFYFVGRLYEKSITLPKFWLLFTKCSITVTFYTNFPCQIQGIQVCVSISPIIKLKIFISESVVKIVSCWKLCFICKLMMGVLHR